MTRASIVSALALSLGLASFGCGTDCTKPENATADACKGTAPDWKTVQGLMKDGGCTLAPCHGTGAPATTKFKAPNPDSASCKSVTETANGLIDKTTAANSRLVTYPFSAQHTGGKMTGWMNATDTSTTKVTAWIAAGAVCP